VESDRGLRGDVDWQLSDAVGSTAGDHQSVSPHGETGSGRTILVAAVLTLLGAAIGIAVLWSSGRRRAENQPEIAVVQPTPPSRSPSQAPKVPSTKETLREVAPPPRVVVEPAPRTRAELEAKLKGTRWKWPDEKIVQGWYILNADGTVTAGWHKQKGSWEVASGSTVNIVVMSFPRTPQTFLASPDLSTLTSTKNGEVHRLLK